MSGTLEPNEALADLAEALYSAVPEEFTARRTEAEKAAKAAKDTALAAAVKALRKPSLGAWAVNVLVRWESGQIDDVFALAEQLREAAASLDGEELRQLTRQRRQLTAALTTRARQLALEHGQRITPSVAEQIEDTLTAAMLDAGVAQAVRSGLLVTTCRATGMDHIDPTTLLAHADALGQVAPAAQPSTRPLHAVPDTVAVRRAAAADLLAAAQERLRDAEQAQQEAEREQSRRQAHVIEVRAELDEWQRRLVDLEARVERAEDEAEAAAEAAQEAHDSMLEAQREHDRAERALREFE